MDCRRGAYVLLTGGLCCLVLVACDRSPQSDDILHDWRRLTPHAVAEQLDQVLSPGARDMAYWGEKPILPALYGYSAQPRYTKKMRDQVTRMKRGEFCATAAFGWQPLGVPPPWDINPPNNNTWDFDRHSLVWTVPLINAWVIENDDEALQLWLTIITDWIEHNSTAPGASAYAWNDHAVAHRVRLLCWFWELWRVSNAYDPELAPTLIGMIYQHALFLGDPAVYPADSNHALSMTGSLLAAAVTFPEFDRAEQWRQLGLKRLADYVAAHFSGKGVHLEQSPGYHGYCLRVLESIVRFLYETGQQLAPETEVRLRRAAAVWPYLVKPDGRVPSVGDTQPKRTRATTTVGKLLGDKPVAGEEIGLLPNPRDDSRCFLLCERAGYALFRPPLDAGPGCADTFILFKCNSFDVHLHHDPLSFVLYGRGRDWFVDPGQYNYEYGSPGREYVCSSRAHTVLLVDHRDFDLRPVEVVASGRTNECDFVQVAHELTSARHTRTFRYLPPYRVEIIDEARSTDGQPHIFTLLFQVAPDLEVKLLPAGDVRLTAPDGTSCLITPCGQTRGTWRIVRGQTEPHYQGWYSPEFNKLVPSPTLFYEPNTPLDHVKFETHIELRCSSEAD
ncbi:MAG: heparinase II/III family protein [Planctomycetota bacterium]